MDQKKKNLRLFFILIGLIISSALIALFPTHKRTTLKNPERFQISDTASVDKINIKSNTLDNELLRTDSGWVINRAYKADANIITVLLSVMKKVEIIRTIGEAEKSEVSDRLKKEGISVSFFSDNKIVSSFVAGSNETHSLSIFKSDENNFYIVQLPGYESYVTGIFEIPAIDWRNRLIVSVGPTNLSKLDVVNYQEPTQSFEVNIDNNFPLISGIEKLDTVGLMDYMDQFNYFQADKFVDPSLETQYDSLASTDPWYKFSFEKYDSTENMDIIFYPRISGDKYIFASNSKGQNALFDYKRISGIFVHKDQFDQNIKKSRFNM